MCKSRCQIKITGTVPSLDFDIRLVNGDVDSEGRLEVFHRGVWGTVCDDGFGGDDAAVVCAYLGYNGTSEAVGSAFYGEGAGDILLDDIACHGNEGSLVQCPHADWTVHNCVHGEDVSVRCNLDDMSGKCNYDQNSI